MCVGLTAETGAGVHGDTVDLEVGVGVCLDRGVWQRGRNKEKQRRLRKWWVKPALIKKVACFFSVYVIDF